MVGVGFDFDHTLGVDNRLERTALLHVLASETPGSEDATVRGELVDAALHAYRSGRDSLESALATLFAKICGSACDASTLFDRFIDETMRLAPEHIEAIAGARELLARLEEAGVPTAILTNGWNPLQQRKADLIGYSGPVIVSDDLGVRKPDGRAFAALAAALELPASSIVYVGDTAEADIFGALNAGMRALWFNWESKSYAATLPTPTAEIARLDQVDAFVLAGVQGRR